MDSSDFVKVLKEKEERRGTPEHLIHSALVGALSAYCAEMYRRIGPEDRDFILRVLNRDDAVTNENETCALV